LRLESSIIFQGLVHGGWPFCSRNGIKSQLAADTAALQL
jgi:hypothetical protein